MAAREPDELDAPLPSPYKGRKGLSRIWHALLNSCAGLADAWRHESAFRQEIALALVMIPLGFMAPVTRGERALLVATVLVVLIVELLNTGVEVAIDRISFERHSLSRRAKDIGSAAVLVALVMMALVWAAILLPLAY